jgi:hypothetical protein
VAQSQNNLVTAIVVDSSKAKADLKLFGAEIQKFTKELRDAVKAGNEAAAAGARQNIEQRYRLMELATASIKKNTAATKESTTAHHEHAGSLREGVRSLAELAHEAGFTVEGMKALKFGFAGLGVALVTRQIRDVIGQLNEYQNTLKRIGGASGTSLEALKETRSTIRATGQDASVADTMIEAFNKKLDEARGKTQGGVQIARGGGGIEQGATVLRPGGGGGTVRDVSTVLRGGRDTEAVNWDDINTALDINTSRLRANNDIRDEQAKKILAITDATTRDNATQAAFHVTFAQGEAAMRQWAGLPPKALTDLEKFNAAVEKLHKQWEDFTEGLVNKYIPSINSALDSLADSGWETQINKGLEDTIHEFEHLLRVGEAIKAWWQGLDQTLKEGHDALWRGLQPRGPGGVPLDPSIPAMPTDGQASGGYIRGPGSGTSDSILARLSNGEFVINAASARRLGTATLQRLNRYASGGNVGGLDYDPSVTDFIGGAPDYRADRPQLSIHERRVLTDAFNKWRAGPGGRADSRGIPLFFSGGLVAAPPIRFAEGGLAGAASSGTPVHLHIGGGTYPVSASSGVAAALVGAAKHNQMISTGIKPSWFGR